MKRCCVEEKAAEMAMQIRVIRRIRQQPTRMVTPAQVSHPPAGLPANARIGTGSTVWTAPPLPVPYPQLRSFTLVEPPGLPWALRIVTY